jgi:hypothetical protein
MVRAHTANALDALAAHPLGSAAIVADGTHAELLKLIDDTEDTVRVATYGSLITLAKSVAGAPTGERWSGNSAVTGGGGGAGALTDCPGFVSKLVSKCLYEPEHLQPFALELLGVLLQQTKAVDLALLSIPPGIDTMVQFLDASSQSVRQKAANCLSALTFPTCVSPLHTSTLPPPSNFHALCCFPCLLQDPVIMLTLNLLCVTQTVTPSRWQRHAVPQGACRPSLRKQSQAI